MSKHEEYLKHRVIIRTGITEDGGWILVFDDESHAYLDPDFIKDLSDRTIEILTKKGE